MSSTRHLSERESDERQRAWQVILQVRPRATNADLNFFISYLAIIDQINRLRLRSSRLEKRKETFEKNYPWLKKAYQIYFAK